MSNAWNFERRSIVCGKFIVGVALITKGRPEVDTSLEAVRNRVRLPPDDALFAARRLSQEELIAFEPGGAVRSKPKGIARAEAMVRAALAQTREFDATARLLRDGGLPLELLKIAVTANGGTLACGGPASDAGTAHRLAFAGDALVVERGTADGGFEAIVAA